MKESAIEVRLAKEIRRAGGQAWKFTSPSRAGVPDRIVLLPGGRVIFVELKTEIGKLSALQKATQEQLRLLGFDVRTLYGIQEVRDFINEVQSMGLSKSGRVVDPLAPEVRALSLDGVGEDSDHAECYSETLSRIAGEEDPCDRPFESSRNGVGGRD
jgi:hypothetical protein